MVFLLTEEMLAEFLGLDEEVEDEDELLSEEDEEDGDEEDYVDGDEEEFEGEEELFDEYIGSEYDEYIGSEYDDGLDEETEGIAFVFPDGDVTIVVFPGSLAELVL